MENSKKNSIRVKSHLQLCNGFFSLKKTTFTLEEALIILKQDTSYQLVMS